MKTPLLLYLCIFIVNIRPCTAASPFLRPVDSNFDTAGDEGITLKRNLDKYLLSPTGCRLRLYVLTLSDSNEVLELVEEEGVNKLRFAFAEPSIAELARRKHHERGVFDFEREIKSLNFQTATVSISKDIAQGLEKIWSALLGRKGAPGPRVVFVEIPIAIVQQYTPDGHVDEGRVNWNSYGSETYVEFFGLIESLKSLRCLEKKDRSEVLKYVEKRLAAFLTQLQGVR